MSRRRVPSAPRLTPADEKAIEAMVQLRIAIKREREQRRARQEKYDAYLAECRVNHPYRWKGA
jgi:hypothetical protein